MSVPDALGLIGSTIDDIRVEACVDEGGFGTVYRGTHLGRNEPVAIKCLRLSRLASLTERMRTAIVARFEEETSILREVSQGTHDIVRCLASGQVFAPATGERVPYIVLEWLDGRTLKADLAERRERGLGGRTWRETLDLVESAALAIAYAHTKGIIHRDIKPSNLMLTKTRGGLRLKVLDFGLAKILTGGPGSRTNIATADGVHLISVGYCSPEQLSASVGEVGPWTDIYSLSLVMLEVMRGEKIPHPTAGALRPSTFGITVPPPIDDLLARALSQSPLERPANAGIFWSSLRELTRQSSPPVADASALAATAFDGDAAAVIAKVRASTAPPNNANPFTGTMVMVNAPGGALHLLAQQQSAAARAPAYGPAPQIGTKSEPPGSTEPMAGRLNAPGPHGNMPYGGTVGLASPVSPLASSLGPSVRSPLAPPLAQPAPAAQPSSPVAQAAPAAQPMPGLPLAPAMQPAPRPPMSSDPRDSVPVQPRRSGLVIALVVAVVLFGLAAAGYFALFRH